MASMTIPTTVELFQLGRRGGLEINFALEGKPVGTLFTAEHCSKSETRVAALCGEELPKPRQLIGRVACYSGGFPCIDACEYRIEAGKTSKTWVLIMKSGEEVQFDSLQSMASHYATHCK